MLQRKENSLFLKYLGDWMKTPTKKTTLTVLMGKIDLNQFVRRVLKKTINHLCLVEKLQQLLLVV